MHLGRVTVFGGSGFIGRYVVQHLARTGAVVRVGVRRPEDGRVLQPLGAVGQIVNMRADVRDPASLRQAVEGADAVINLVGILYQPGRATFSAIHADGAANVAQAARDAGAKRLVQMSALGADPYSRSNYARSKAAGEKAVLSAFPQATILRPSVVFGPEDRFFNLFANLARFSPALPVFGCPPPRFTGGGVLGFDIYGDGGTRFQPVFVGDVADAVMTVLERRECGGRTYELGGPGVYSFKEIMELVLRHSGRRRLLLPVPFWVARLMAAFLELAPGQPLLTRDQVTQLERDNVVGKKARGFRELGIVPRAAEIILPTYMDQYRRGGRFRSRLA